MYPKSTCIQLFFWPQDHALESESACLSAGEVELSGFSRVRCSLSFENAMLARVRDSGVRESDERSGVSL